MSNQTVDFGDVSVKDVAKDAKVSIATVSRVINSSGSVREQTRQKVLEAVEKLGYFPNYRARSFRSQKSHAITMVLPPGGSSDRETNLIIGADEALKAHGYIGHYIHTTTQESVMGAVELYNNRRIDGLLFSYFSIRVGRVIKVAVEQKIPSVIINWPSSKIGMPQVSVNNFKGGKMLTDHLVELGHRRIMFLAGPGDWNEEQNCRIAGFRESLSENGLLDSSTIFHSCGWDANAGYAAAERMIKEKTIPTAIFCYSDLIAYGVLSAFYQNGISVPERVSVAGFSNHHFSSHSCPTLTSTLCPDQAIGLHAAKTLINLINYPDRPVEMSCEFDPELVIRNSTGLCKYQ